MMTQMAELLRLRAREAESRLTHHPSPEELVAYHGGRLSDEDGNRLQGHLVLCRECSALYLDLVEMVEETPPVDNTEWVSAWPEMERRFKEGSPEAAPPAASAAPASAGSTLAEPAAPGRFRPRFFPSPRLAYALAASFFATTCGLLVWSLSLRANLDSLSAPQMNVAVHDLDPGSPVRAEGGAVSEPVEISEGTDRIVLILNPGEAPSEPSYRVRVLDRSGRELWSGRGLRPTSFGNFTLELSRRSFPGERYLIEVWNDRERSDPEGRVDRFEVRLPSR